MPVLVDRGAVARAAGLVDAARVAGWFLPEHLWSLYVWTPLVALSGVVLLLLPGWQLAACARGPSSAGRRLLLALGLGFLVITPAAAIVQQVAGDPVTGTAFVVLLIGLAVAASAVRLWRERTAPEPAPATRAPWRELAWIALPPLVLLVALFPKVFWESFNPDGAHAFEVGRLAMRRVLPFWPAEYPDGLRAFPGLTSALFAWPESWFLRMFGEVEAAARLPFLLYFGATFGAVCALAGHDRGDAPRGALANVAIWCALATYAVVMAYSATYSPYGADLALPATQDTLLIVMFAAFVLAFLRREPLGVAAFAALTYLAQPAGALLIALWMSAAALVLRPRPWRMAVIACGVLAACVLWSRFAPGLHAALGWPAPGGEYDRLTSRFAQLAFTQVRRLLFAIVPGGILPFFAIVAWRRLDGPARALLLAAYAYCAIFYVQAYVSLHHFVPAMLLPLFAFWRAQPDGGRRAAAFSAAALLFALVALGLSLPPDASVDTTSRDVGRMVADARPGYAALEPGWYRGADLLHELFPREFDARVPEHALGGSAFAWARYARASVQADTNYVLVPAGVAGPPGARRVAAGDSAALFVRSEALLDAHRALRPPSRPGSALYVIPRAYLFPKRPSEAPPGVIQAKAILEALGLKR